MNGWGAGMQGLGLLLSLGRQRSGKGAERRFRAQADIGLEKDLFNRLAMIKHIRNVSRAGAAYGSFGRDSYDPRLHGRKVMLGETQEVAPQAAQIWGERDRMEREINDMLARMRMQRKRGEFGMTQDISALFSRMT